MVGLRPIRFATGGSCFGPTEDVVSTTDDSALVNSGVAARIDCASVTTELIEVWLPRVMDPFADVSVHVRQAESVRLFAADRFGVATIFLEYPRCVSQCCWIIPGVEEGCCTGPAGEFPFGFGGQSISQKAEPLVSDVKIIQLAKVTGWLGWCRGCFQPRMTRMTRIRIANGFEAIVGRANFSPRTNTEFHG